MGIAVNLQYIFIIYFTFTLNASNTTRHGACTIKTDRNNIVQFLDNWCKTLVIELNIDWASTVFICVSATKVSMGLFFFFIKISNNYRQLLVVPNIGSLICYNWYLTISYTRFDLFENNIMQRKYYIILNRFTGILCIFWSFF